MEKVEALTFLAEFSVTLEHTDRWRKIFILSYKSYGSLVEAFFFSFLFRNPSPWIGNATTWQKNSWKPEKRLILLKYGSKGGTKKEK